MNGDLKKLASAEDVSVERELAHKVYEAALDNTLWPELIVDIVDHVDRIERIPSDKRDAVSLDSINQHLNRAYAISARMVGLQQQNHEMSKVLDALSFDVTLIRSDGGVYSKSRLTGGGDQVLLPALIEEAVAEELPGRIELCLSENEAQCWIETGESDQAYLLLPKEEITELGFPAAAEMVLINLPLDATNAIASFASSFGLSPSEARLLRALCEAPDLKTAATESGVSYETGRQYLKSIFKKSGVATQAGLMKALFFRPSVFLPATANFKGDIPPVRRIHRLAEGRDLEYFSLGPEDGHPIIFFDAMAGAAIDLVGAPRQYAARLEELGARVVTPCRPGTFRSTHKPLQSLKEWAVDIRELCEALGFDRVSIFSYSYGSNAALAAAHELPDLVERVTMSSVSYRPYVHDNWREMDLFFQVTNIIGRRWPRLLNQLIPFLARTIIYDIHRFSEKKAKAALSEHERAILRDKDVVERTRDRLIERTSRGMNGVIDEYKINAQPYDFDVAAILAPMTLFHGDCDVNNPLGGARMLVEDAQRARLHVLPGMGHHHIFYEWNWLLAAACGADFQAEMNARLHDAALSDARAGTALPRA